MGKCSIMGCNSEDAGIVYLGKPLCDKCWGSKPHWRLREILTGVKAQDRETDKEKDNGRAEIQAAR
jgi:hypothetical protein